MGHAGYTGEYNDPNVFTGYITKRGHIHAYTPCIRLADLNGDGEHRLLVGDSDRKLKIYKGTALVSEHALLDVPVALCAFYTDTNVPRTPAVAVASGPYVFIYRNLRPYFKFTLPPLEINAEESRVWNELESEELTAANAHELLSTARCKGKTLMQQTVITCMETLNKNMDEHDAVSSLVIGTESKQVLILKPSGTQILSRCSVGGVPVHMAVTGLYDVDYRVVVACRNGSVYTIKNGEVAASVIELETQPCGLVRLDKSIIVPCMDSVVHSFHIKGKKNYSIYLPAPVTNVAPLSLRKTRIVNALLVALENGTVRLYNNKHLVSELQIDGIITAMRFGTFSREESSLVMVHKVSSKPPGPPPEQDIPLDVPKKTKLYVEQTQRERDQATEMHRIFQRDLCKLRLSTAKHYVKIITDGQGPVSYAAGASLRLNAQVQGLGPLFKIKLSIQNAGSKSMTNVPMTCGYNHDLYRLNRGVHYVPLLVPGLLYHYEIDVECVDENGGADTIRIFVCNPRSCVPVISALVNMPISEPLID
eukprot:g776.t1